MYLEIVCDFDSELTVTYVAACILTQQSLDKYVNVRMRRDEINVHMSMIELSSFGN